MKKTHIVLADLNEAYLVTIEMKLIHELGYEMELELITEREYFDTYFSMPRKADILVISEELLYPDIEKHDIKNIFVLRNRSGYVDDEETSFNNIYRYSSVKEIYNEIDYTCGLDQKNGLQEKKETKIITMYSPSGGTGKTSLALATAGFLGENYQRVLYIDAEYLQTFHRWMSNQEGLSSEDARELSMADTNIYSVVRRYIRSEGFDYIPPFRGALSAYAMDESIYLKIIEMAKASGDYEYIIVDTDKSLDDFKFSLFGLSNVVFLIQRDSAGAVFDMQTFRKNIDMRNAEKYIVVCNQYDEAHVSEDIPAMEYPVAGYIKKYDETQLSSLKALRKMEGVGKLLLLVG